MTQPDSIHSQPTLRIRPTHRADLSFVTTAEQHPANAAYVDLWSQAQHEAAIDSSDYGHFILETTVDQSSDRRQENEKALSVGYLIVAGLQDPHQALLLKRIVVMHKGKGYGRQALRWVKSFTFEQLGYRRLWLDVVSSNQRAQALYLSEGFIIESTFREAYKTTEGYQDMLILSMLATDR